MCVVRRQISVATSAHSGLHSPLFLSVLTAEFLHVKPGKGAAFVRTKLRNYVTGNTVERTFRAGESVSLQLLPHSQGRHCVMVHIRLVCALLNMAG